MKRLRYTGLLLLTLCMPLAATAANFAQDPIFLSRSPATEGVPVRIFAVIQNNDSSTFTGTLVFYDNTTKIGSSNINLAAGATQTASATWIPTVGTHPISAQLVTSYGVVTEKMEQSFTITGEVSASTAADTQTVATTGAFSNTTQTAAAIDSSAAIQQQIASLSPQVASTTKPVFTFIDNARASVADTLDTQINTTKAKITVTPKTTITGATTVTSDPKIENPTSGMWYWVYNIYLYILLAARWLVGNAGVFYPVLAFLFLYFLYRMYRRFRRPAWDR